MPPPQGSLSTRAVVTAPRRQPGATTVTRTSPGLASCSLSMQVQLCRGALRTVNGPARSALTARRSPRLACAAALPWMVDLALTSLRHTSSSSGSDSGGHGQAAGEPGEVPRGAKEMRRLPLAARRALAGRVVARWNEGAAAALAACGGGGARARGCVRRDAHGFRESFLCLRGAWVAVCVAVRSVERNVTAVTCLAGVAPCRQAAGWRGRRVEPEVHDGR